MAKVRQFHGEAAGGRHTKEYKAWTAMRYRCENERHPSFAHYGGRGIKVCERWRGPNGFANFLADMGRAPPDTSIHRVNNDGGYEPANCRWVGKKEQQTNCRWSIWVRHNGKRLPLADAAAMVGLPRVTVYARVRAGWPEDRWLEPASKNRPYSDRVQIEQRVQHAKPTRPEPPPPPKPRDRSKERKTYEAMRDRCCNPNNPSWLRYGGRGIKVCERWLGPDGFTNFLADMGRAPIDTSLDRVDPNKDYDADNCRWATQKEQQRNRTNTPWVTYKGQFMALSEAAEMAGLQYITVWQRWRRGWPEDRLFEPATNRRSQREWVRSGTSPMRGSVRGRRKSTLAEKKPTDM